MESFHLSFKDVMWGISWINLRLLMIDKLHYVGEGKGKKEKVKISKLTKEQEYKALKSLIG